MSNNSDTQPVAIKSGESAPTTVTWRNVLPIHQAAEIMPRIADYELRELAAHDQNGKVSATRVSAPSRTKLPT